LYEINTQKKTLWQIASFVYFSYLFYKFGIPCGMPISMIVFICEHGHEYENGHVYEHGYEDMNMDRDADRNPDTGTGTEAQTGAQTGS
jgi:hypothetical protein